MPNGLLTKYSPALPCIIKMLYCLNGFFIYFWLNWYYAKMPLSLLTFNLQIFIDV